LAAGRKWRGIKGDSSQLGGDFAIGVDGVVYLAYRSHDPTDRPFMEQILATVNQIAERNLDPTRNMI
jgi:hypothetical protein